MFTEKWLAIIGVFLLAVGMFLPTWRDERGKDTSLNLIDISPESETPEDGPGVYILILAAVTLLLLMIDRLEYTWVTTMLAFLSLFIIFSNFWASAFNDTGISLEFGWSVILGGLILMNAPFWPESLKLYLGWLGTEEENNTIEENPESVEENEA